MNVSAQVPFPYDIVFSDDGREMFVTGIGSNSILQYTLSAPFDLAAVNNTATFTFGEPDGLLASVEFSRDGTTMFVLDDKSVISRYSLPDAFTLNGTVTATRRLI